jgi:hypothetical protein
MSYELFNERGDSFNFNFTSWPYYLALAEEYGWQPAGTDAPDGRAGDWSGTYCTNDGQWVSAVDAEAIANALQQAVDNHDPARVERSCEMARMRTADVREAIQVATGCDFFGGRVDRYNTPFLREMIAFFRKGRFQIW